MRREDPLEKTIEAKVLLEAKRLGIMVRKLNGEGQRGWPDRMFCVPGGRPLFIEFKRKGRELDPLQRHICGQLKKEGYNVEVADSPEDGIRFLRAALEAAQVPGKSDAASTREVRCRIVPGPWAG